MKVASTLLALALALAAFGAEFAIFDSSQGALGLERLFFEAMKVSPDALPDDLEIVIQRTGEKHSADVIAVELPVAAPAPEGLSMLQVARYPALVAVNSENPIRGLSAETLRKIFTGQIKSWEQIGPWHGEILRAGCQPNTPPGRAFRQFVMGEDVWGGKAPLPGHEILPGIIWLNKPEYAVALATADNVILFGGWELAAMPGLQVIAIGKVAPTAENIETGNYPALLDFVFLYQGANPPEHLQVVADYLRSGAIRAGAYQKPETR